MHVHSMKLYGHVMYVSIHGYDIQNKICVSCLIHVLLRTVSKEGDKTRKLIGRNFM